MFVTKKVKNESSFWDQEMCFNNAKIQNYIPFKTQGVRRLEHLYYDTGTVWEKKNLQLFHVTGYSPKYGIKYKDKMCYFYFCKAWNKYLDL